MKKDKKKKRLITGIILGGVALFLLAMVVSYLNDQLSRDYTEVQATVQSIVTDQRFTGVIESRNREDIVSSQALEIDEIYVAEGDPVENESLLLDTSYGAQYESTIIGEVSKIYFKEGDQVPAGAKMMDIVDFNNLQVAIKVDEYEIANIQVGLDVRILIDSINQEAAGVVRDISREAVNQDGLSYFTAIVDFQRDGEIRVGMNAEIIIEKERADQSLTLPMEALQFDAENKPWVLVKEESGETSERSLDLGINDGVNIEVRAGISDSEIVLVPQAMSEGFPMGPPEGVGGQSLMSQKILEMKDLTKVYAMGEEEVFALRGIDLTIDRGDFVSVLGPSGSGKTTLMNIIGCLDVPTSGTYKLSRELIEGRSETELSHIRNREIGFIFQQFQLLPRLSALKNVELPLIYAGIPEKERKERSEKILERVGLGDKMRNRPNQLSGGQQQRVAIARALVTEPTLLLADEPTGALDQKTGCQILDLFTDLYKEGKTIVMITHDPLVAKNGSRIVDIVDGNLTEGQVHV